MDRTNKERVSCVRSRIGLVASAILAAVSCLAADETDRAPEDWQTLRAESVAKGVNFLIDSGQSDTGSFSQSADPGITALCTAALLRSGRTEEDPAVQRSLQYLLTFVQPDGGIYRPGTVYQNYETSIAMLALQEANGDGRYRDVLERAAAFTRGLQWDEGEGKDIADPAYGGAGYGNHKRPDLSNTQFFIDALKSQQSEENRAAIQRALIFVSRSQNLESEHNALPFAPKNPDGGFYYTPAAGGSSQAGTLPNGGLRSYGSMTYAGLKSMIHAGLGPDDPRVRAAKQWIGKHYSLDENPGMADAGLYYYYHTFAKALHALGDEQFVDAAGVQHPWCEELTRKLASLQRPDGSWVNTNERWLEGDANLVTAYALLALSYCR